MASALIWANRCSANGPCRGCPGAAMGYPVLVGPPDALVCVVAQDPNYSLFSSAAVVLHNQLTAIAASQHGPWEQIERRLWMCRSLDPRNKLVVVRSRVADAASIPVEQVYFTNLAKCGSRGACGTAGGGALRERIGHCRAYLDDELTHAGRHTIIAFGRHAAEAVSEIFGVSMPPLRVDGEIRSVDGRHLIFFRHWGRAPRGFLEMPALDRHFTRYPLE